MTETVSSTVTSTVTPPSTGMGPDLAQGAARPASLRTLRALGLGWHGTLVIRRAGLSVDDLFRLRNAWKGGLSGVVWWSRAIRQIPGATGGDLVRWQRSGLQASGMEGTDFVAVMRQWYTFVGPDASWYAAAGMSMAEARVRALAGQTDRSDLALLAGLRG